MSGGSSRRGVSGQAVGRTAAALTRGACVRPRPRRPARPRRRRRRRRPAARRPAARRRQRARRIRRPAGRRSPWLREPRRLRVRGARLASGWPWAPSASWGPPSLVGPLARLGVIGVGPGVGVRGPGPAPARPAPAAAPRAGPVVIGAAVAGRLAVPGPAERDESGLEESGLEESGLEESGRDESGRDESNGSPLGAGSARARAPRAAGAAGTPPAVAGTRPPARSARAGSVPRYRALLRRCHRILCRSARSRAFGQSPVRLPGARVRGAPPEGGVPRHATAHRAGAHCQQRRRRSRIGGPGLPRYPRETGSTEPDSLSSRHGPPAPQQRLHNRVSPARRASEPCASRVIMGGSDGTRPCRSRSAVSTSSGRTAGAVCRTTIRRMAQS